MNIPVEIVAVCLAALFAAVGWIVKKVIAIDKKVDLLADHFGLLEKKYEADAIVRPRVAGAALIGRMHHKPHDGSLPG